MIVDVTEYVAPYIATAIFVWLIGAVMRDVNSSPHGTPEYVRYGAVMQLLAPIWPLLIVWVAARALCALAVVVVRHYMSAWDDAWREDR